MITEQREVIVGLLTSTTSTATRNYSDKKPAPAEELLPTQMIAYTHPTPDGCTLQVRIHPGARKNAITGIHAGALKISLTTPPVDGRANEALIAFLSDRLRIPKACISLISGQTNRSKTLRIATLTAPQVEAALLTTLA